MKQARRQDRTVGQPPGAVREEDDEDVADGVCRHGDEEAGVAGRLDHEATRCVETRCAARSGMTASDGYIDAQRPTITRSEIESRPQAVRGRLAVRLGGGLDRDAAADEGHRDRLRRPLQCRQVEPDQRADRPQGAGAHLAHAGPHPGTDLLQGPGRRCGSSTCRATATPRRRRRRSRPGPTDPRLSCRAAPISPASMC